MNRNTLLAESGLNITSFGEDLAGGLYVFPEQVGSTHWFRRDSLPIAGHS